MGRSLRCMCGGVQAGGCCCSGTLLLAGCIPLRGTQQQRQSCPHTVLRVPLCDAQVVIPRPARGGGPDPAGVGLVFLEYEDARSAEKARLALDGRAFGDSTVKATLFDEAAFAAGAYE